MPPVLYGTWHLNEGVAETVKTAIEIGYRGIDSAYSYGNDFQVGKAIKACGLLRSEIFVTNKVWNSFRGRQAVVEACKKSLRLMKMEYFDLYLIHWPEPVTNPDWADINSDTWQGMEVLYGEGLVRAIGVSNFLPHHLYSLLSNGAAVCPMVNQIEFHPGRFQDDVLRWCSDKKIIVEGWSPLGSGGLLHHPLLISIAEKYHCSVAQVVLVWAVQKGVVPIPRSSDSGRMRENLFLPRLQLQEEDIVAIEQLHDIGCSEYVPDVKHPK